MTAAALSARRWSRQAGGDPWTGRGCVAVSSSSAACARLRPQGRRDARGGSLHDAVVARLRRVLGGGAGRGGGGVGQAEHEGGGSGADESGHGGPVRGQHEGEGRVVEGEAEGVVAREAACE